MKLNDLKIGVKLNSGFIFASVLTLVVGVISFVNVSKIVDELEISKIVNKIIADAGAAESGSLNYMINGEEEYFLAINENIESIKTYSAEVKELLSDDNKKIADEISNLIMAYEANNQKNRELALKKDTINEQREFAASEAINQITNVINAETNYSNENKSDYGAVERVFSFIEAKNAMNRVRSTAYKYVANPNETYEMQLKNELDGITQILITAEQETSSLETQMAMFDAIGSIEVYRNEFDNYKSVVEEQLEIQDSQLSNAARLLESSEQLREGVYTYIDATKSKAITQIVLFVIIAIITGIVIGSLITRNITHPLAKGVQFANSISEGDLTKDLEISQKDEIGQLANAMNNMLLKLKDIVTSVISGSSNIASASLEITSTSQQISNGASEQASSVEEVSSTMEEIAANIQQNTDNAIQTEKISDAAKKGIEEVSQSSNETIEANKQIAEKINIVSDIAFQTNLLALNAAVEAARAGDHGKGFAVVAAEVRKLAERSKVAANEIVELAKNSLKQAENTGKKMEEILPEVVKTAQLVQEITSASQEQNNGANQVNNAMQQLNGVTQQNAAASEELASNSEEMNSQAEQLQEVISFFRIDTRMQTKKESKVNTTTSRVYKTESKKPVEKKGKMVDSFDFNMDGNDSDFEKF